MVDEFTTGAWVVVVITVVGGGLVTVPFGIFGSNPDKKISNNNNISKVNAQYQKFA